MAEERMRILEMLEQGKINAAQAERLLSALEQAPQGPLRTPQSDEAPPAKRKLENYGDSLITADLLARLPENSIYTNYGDLVIAGDVTPEALAAKIGEFTNYGLVIGPEPLLGVLQSRCLRNYGDFRPPKAAKGA